MIHFHVTGPERKRLVKRLEMRTGQKARYLGAPSMAFQVADLIVTRDGAVEGELPKDFLTALARAGLRGEVIEPPQTGTVIQIPADVRTADNFYNMTASKAALIKQSFDLGGLPVEYCDGTIAVRWFEQKALTAEERRIATQFVTAMVRTAKMRKFVSAKPLETDNPKYNFRVFLNTLGFVGPKHKSLRKALLKNMEGCAALRRPKPKTPLTADGTTIL